MFRNSWKCFIVDAIQLYKTKHLQEKKNWSKQLVCEPTARLGCIQVPTNTDIVSNAEYKKKPPIWKKEGAEDTSVGAQPHWSISIEERASKERREQVREKESK